MKVPEGKIIKLIVFVNEYYSHSNLILTRELFITNY